MPYWHSNTWKVTLVGWLEWNMPGLDFCHEKGVYIKNWLYLRHIFALVRNVFLIQHVKNIYFCVMLLELQSMISVIVIKDIVGTYNARICGNTIFWINNMYHRSVHQKLKLKIFKTIVFRPLFLYIRCTFIFIYLHNFNF